MVGQSFGADVRLTADFRDNYIWGAITGGTDTVTLEQIFERLTLEPAALNADDTAGFQSLLTGTVNDKALHRRVDRPVLRQRCFAWRRGRNVPGSKWTSPKRACQAPGTPLTRPTRTNTVGRIECAFGEPSRAVWRTASQERPGRWPFPRLTPPRELRGTPASPSRQGIRPRAPASRSTKPSARVTKTTTSCSTVSIFCHRQPRD